MAVHWIRDGYQEISDFAFFDEIPNGMKPIDDHFLLDFERFTV